MSLPSSAALQPLVRQLAEMFVSEVRDLLAGSPSPKSDALRVADVARELGVSPKKVYGWIKSKRLTAIDLNPPGSERTSYSISRVELFHRQ